MNFMLSFVVFNYSNTNRTTKQHLKYNIKHMWKNGISNWFFKLKKKLL
jgi:hypothetical protein